MIEVKKLTDAYFEINQHNYIDYLNIDSDLLSFDWDKFFIRYHENLIYELYEQESFNIIKDEVLSKDRRHIEYSFDVKGNLFKGIVDIVTCESELDSLNKDIVLYQIKKVSTNMIDSLKEAYNKNPKKFIIKYRFIDAESNMFITNKIGNLAFLVLRMATKCLLDSISKIGLDNLFGLEFHVAKSEIKRLDLYKKLLIKSNLDLENSFEGELPID